MAMASHLLKSVYKLLNYHIAEILRAEVLSNISFVETFFGVVTFIVNVKSSDKDLLGIVTLTSGYSDTWQVNSGLFGEVSLENV